MVADQEGFGKTGAIHFRQQVHAEIVVAEYALCGQGVAVITGRHQVFDGARAAADGPDHCLLLETERHTDHQLPAVGEDTKKLTERAAIIRKMLQYIEEQYGLETAIVKTESRYVLVSDPLPVHVDDFAGFGLCDEFTSNEQRVTFLERPING